MQEQCNTAAAAEEEADRTGDQEVQSEHAHAG